MSTIALIGYRGSGKSTLGKWLAVELNKPFIDTDDKVMAELGYTSIKEVWESLGEAGWRAAEARIIPLLLLKDAVVALGGGAPMLPVVAAALQSVPIVLNLCASQEVTIARIERGHDRPQLNASDIDTLQHRLPTYLKLGTHLIDTSGDVVTSKVAILEATIDS